MHNETSGKKVNNKKTLRRILHYIRPYTALVTLSLLLSALTVGLTLYIPILTGRGVDYIVGEGQVDFTGLLAVIAGILISIAVTAVAQWVMNHINNKVTYRIVRDLRVQAFDHLQELPLSYVDRHSSGDLLSRVITDIDQFSDGLLLGFTQLFTGVATIVGTIIFMLGINPWITLIVVVLSPLSFLVADFISKKSFTMFKKQSETRGELTGFTNEMLGGIKVVQAFGYQDEAYEEFDEINKRLSEYSLKATFFSSITNPATRFMYSAIYAGVAIAGCFSVMGGMLTVGQLSSFLSYTNQYTKPFNDITSVLTEFQNSIASAARVFELIDEPAAPADPADAVVLTEPEGRILLKDVDFSYTPERAPDPGSESLRKAGAADRHRGAHRLRKDHPHQPAHAFLRCAEGLHPGGRPRHTPDHPPLSSHQLRHGPPGDLAEIRIHPGQHRLRPARRQPGRDHRGSQEGPRPQLYHAYAGGI